MLDGDLSLAELLGGLSLACDLADGFAAGKVLRTVVLGTRLAAQHGMSALEQHDVYYVNLLRYAGCTAFSHEEAHVYGAGDDIGTRSTMALVDAGDPVQLVGRVLRGIGAGGALPSRVKAVARLLGDGVAVQAHARSQCDASVRMAEMVQMGPRVCAALRQICERWDGKGAPSGDHGEALELAIRVHHLVDVAELVHQEHGRSAAIEVVRKRAGGQFDPELAQTFIRHADELLAPLEQPALWETFLAAEPRPRAIADDARLDEVAHAFAYFADLKSVFTLGHSHGVAQLAVATAELLGMPERQRRELRRAALLHDLGCVAVPSGIWDKPDKLSIAEQERVRLHAYYTERVLVQSPALRPLAALASGAHERSDGNGYHRSLPRKLQPLGMRVLAVADTLHALREPRPQRPARSAEQARSELLAEVKAGHFEAELVDAALAAADGGRPRPRSSWPLGLSDREVEVLRLLARGGSNKQIGAALEISAKTVQHHVAHVYAKLGVSSRAAAAMFATEHELLGD